MAAATLRAAAGQMIKTDDLTDTVEDVIRGAERHRQSGWLHTIATELEGSMTDSTLSDRMALAVCPRQRSGATPCLAPCIDCLAIAKAVAHEIADHFSELYGGASTTADTLYAVGCHQPDTKPSIQDGWKALERTQDPRMWLPIDPEKETAAIAIARKLRGPDG